MNFFCKRPGCTIAARGDKVFYGQASSVRSPPPIPIRGRDADKFSGTAVFPCYSIKPHAQCSLSEANGCLIDCGCRAALLPAGRRWYWSPRAAFSSQCAAMARNVVIQVCVYRAINSTVDDADTRCFPVTWRWWRDWFYHKAGAMGGCADHARGCKTLLPAMRRDYGTRAGSGGISSFVIFTLRSQNRTVAQTGGTSCYSLLGTP